VLEGAAASGGVLRLSRRLAANGLEACRIARRHGYEGLIAKGLSSPCVPRRAKSWQKVKVHQEDEFVIVGYTAPAGSRQHLGALLRGGYSHDKLRYVDRVAPASTTRPAAHSGRHSP
jgi:bifunctional non-homologous end joining protein LigD